MTLIFQSIKVEDRSAFEYLLPLYKTSFSIKSGIYFYIYMSYKNLRETIEFVGLSKNE